MIVLNRSLRTLFLAHGQGVTLTLLGLPRAVDTGCAIGGRQTPPLFDDNLPENSLFESNELKAGRRY